MKWDWARQARRPALGAIFLCLASVNAFGQSSPSGGIRGVVVDQDFGVPVPVPVPGVRVTVVGVYGSEFTGQDGNFFIRSIPPGTYAVTFQKNGYERRIVTDVVVLAGQLADVRVELPLEVATLGEMVVTGGDLFAGTENMALELRQEAATVQDSISSELISKAGASDLAGALKLVVGASVADGKYATVRGLSDRYTGTTLDGVRIPSADPRKRAVQIDIFPTGTIENVTVTKSFTPDLQGDFTGGGVDIQTKSIPDEPILSVSLSTESNSEATGNDRFLTYDGGGVPATGFADGDRDFPADALVSPSKSLNAVVFSPTPTPADAAASAQFDRRTRAFEPVMGTSRTAPGPNYALSVVAGKKYPAGEGSFGALGALTYARRYDYYEGGENNTGGKDGPSLPITISTDRSDSQGTDELLVGMLGSLGWQINADHELTLKAILNQSAQDDARYQEEQPDLALGILNQSLRYTERTVGSGQLHGDHVITDVFGGPFSNLELNWFGAYNLTRQVEPDVRYFRYEVDWATGNGNRPSNSTEVQNSRRFSRDISEAGFQGALNAEIPFKSWGQLEGMIKAGFFADGGDRTYQQDSFYYSFAIQYRISQPGAQCNLSKSNFRPTQAGQIWTDVFLDSDRIGLAPALVHCDFFPDDVPQPTPAANQLLWVVNDTGIRDVDYDGTQAIDAYYAMAEIPLHAKLRFVGGARSESTKITISPKSASGGLDVVTTQEDENGNLSRVVTVETEEQAQTNLDDSAILPSAALIWEPKDRMNIRGSWSRTLARPTFRELAPTYTEEFLAGDQFLGNPFLKLSSITNYDLRWEWFRGPGQVLAASVFYKSISDPIELISFQLFGSSPVIQPVNYEHGSVRGAEIEFRAPLDVFWEPVRGLAVGANVAWIDSQVEVPQLEQDQLAPFGLAEPERRLQGQPDSLVNINATYDNDDWGTSVGLFYNRNGETLYSGAAVGSFGTPNVFEAAFATLDLTFAQKLKKIKAAGTTVTFKAKNLLQSEVQRFYRAPDGQEAVKSERSTALLISIGVAFSF